MQRPLANSAPVTEQPTDLAYSDESDISAATESDSDSDAGHTQIKKPKIKIKRSKLIFQQSRSDSNEKYKVWCTQVQEEALTEDLVSCGVTKKFYKDRNVESYDFTLGYNDNDRCQKDSSDEEQVQVRPRLNNKRTFADRKDVKLRLGKRRPDFEEENTRGCPRIIEELRVTVESADEEVAAEIANRLHEKKDTLISEY